MQLNLEELKSMQINDRQKAIQDNVLESRYSVMFLALVEEIGEYVASLGYPDWKKVPRDEENMKIELADIAIFAMNCEYYDSKTITKPAYDAGHLGFKSDLSFVDQLLRMTVECEFSQIPSFIISNHPEIYRLIEGKQALNIIRRYYGYDKGHYTKMYGDVEDNKVMLDLVEKNVPELFNAIALEAKKYQRVHLA